MKWFETSYRRNLVDMHIEEWDQSFMSKLSATEYVENLKKGKVKSAMIYSHSHIGLCNWPTVHGKMHPGLRGYDFIGDVTHQCHQNDIDVQIYYSLIYDNYCYKDHPDWRMLNIHGVGTKEKVDAPDHMPHRYGNICPNSLPYREYTKKQLKDLMDHYQFEGFFLDMLFWPVVCYCDNCKKRFADEVGGEIPQIINWDDSVWLAFQEKREQWIGEFAFEITNFIKGINPDMTVEHQFSPSAASWRFAVTESISDASDYTGGDFYGGFLQQSFVSKMYRNVSRALPFIYHTSRCAPNLAFHTVTKSFEELSLHNYLTLAHHGAFLFIDAIDPDGSMQSTVYETMGKVYEDSMPLEQHVGGEPICDVALYFPLTGKLQPELNCKKVPSIVPMQHPLIEDSIKIAANIRKYNLPFDVITARGLQHLQAKLLIIPEVYLISDAQATEILQFVSGGGSVYLRGQFHNQMLSDALGITFIGTTVESITYMAPTDEGLSMMPGFCPSNPLTIPAHQCIISLSGEAQILAKTILPYTIPGDTDKFASGWSNPPSRKTQGVALFKKQIGKGQVIWSAGPLEIVLHESGSAVFEQMVRHLVGDKPTVLSNAPAPVEIKVRNKNGRYILDVINEQEQMPIMRLCDITISVYMGGISAKKAVLLGSGQELSVTMQDGYASFTLPQLHIYEMIELIT